MHHGFPEVNKSLRLHHYQLKHGATRLSLHCDVCCKVFLLMMLSYYLSKLSLLDHCRWEEKNISSMRTTTYIWGRMALALHRWLRSSEMKQIILMSSLRWVMFEPSIISPSTSFSSLLLDFRSKHETYDRCCHFNDVECVVQKSATKTIYKTPGHLMQHMLLVLIHFLSFSFFHY